MSTGKVTRKQAADIKNKGPYLQADLGNCFGIYLSTADLHKTQKHTETQMPIEEPFWRKAACPNWWIS